jgi:hypothetical protein
MKCSKGSPAGDEKWFLEAAIAVMLGQREKMRSINLMRVLGLGLMGLLLMGSIGLTQSMQPHEGMGQGGPMRHEPVMMAVPPQEGPPDMGVPIELLHSGHGFAIKENESWVFRLNIERRHPIEPMAVMLLLASNRSLEEIRDEIRAKGGGATYRGSMRLDRTIYPLVNINVAALAENATVEADVAALALDSFNDTQASIAGHIRLEIAPFEGGLTGKGELAMNNGPDAGRYRILLEMMPPTREMMMRGDRE